MLAFSFILAASFTTSMSNVWAQSESRPTAPILAALERAYRGFISVSFPSGFGNTCIVKRTSDFNCEKVEVRREWYQVSLESSCPDEADREISIWFVCTDLPRISCSLTNPPLKESPTDQ